MNDHGQERFESDGCHLTIGTDFFIVSANESARFLRQTSDERDNNRALCGYYIMRKKYGKRRGHHARIGQDVLE